MKKIFLYFFLSLLVGSISAQQLPHFSQYFLNDYAENPAIGGKNPYFEASSINRYQWIGITDAPRTYMLTVNGPLKNPSFGVGGQIFTDIVGPTRRTGCYLSYAYHAKLSEDVKLSFGLQGGILQFMVDGSKITLRDPVDNVISSGLQSVLMPDFGFGLYAYNKDKWYIGASVPQIMQNKIRFFDYQNNSNSVINRHYFLTAGYKFRFNDDWALQPSTIVRFVDPAPVQFDLTLRVIYKDKVWLGGSYRNLDAMSMMIGYVYRENIIMGYAFDFSTTNIQNYSTGTHEVFLGLRFNHSPAGKGTESMF